MFGPQYELSVAAALGVTTGEPHWRVYQSRLLGPYLVKAVSLATGSFTVAHALCTIVLLGASGFLVLAFLRRQRGTGWHALAGYFAFVFLVVCCFQRPWLYIWDFTGLLVFVLFNQFVAQRRGYRWFCALFLLALLDRETAGFIALWMILDPLVRVVLARRPDGSRGAFDLKMAGSGIALLGGGIALVEFLRSALLVREVGPSLVGPVRGAGPSFHTMLPENIDQLVVALTSFRYSLSFLIPLLLAAYAAFAVRVAWRDPPERTAVAAVHLLMLASLAVFGILFETRVYLILLPFVVFNLGPRSAVSLP